MTLPTGYTRVILAGLSLHFMSYHPKYCTLAYCISCLLDAVDGQVARALGQTSKFGAVLDMVTDRCAHHVSCFFPDSDHCSKGVPHHVFSAIFPPHTQVSRLFSSSLSHSTSRATTCTCIGRYRVPLAHVSVADGFFPLIAPL